MQTMELWPPSFLLEGPPQSLEKQFSWLSERLEILGEYFDAFHIADLKATERRYMDSVMTAIRLREKSKWLELAPTITARDRNRKALQEAVASSLFFGLDNLILVWGDPHPVGKGRPKNVYDVSGVSGLVKLAREAQRRTGHPSLCLLTPIDLSKVKDAGYLEMVKKREAASSDVFISQTFFGEPEDYLSLLDALRAEGVRSPVLHNVFPLLSFDDAVQIRRRFGVDVSRRVLDRLKDGGVAAGVRMAARFRDVLESNRGKVNGVYVSSRGEPELAIRLVK